MREIRRVGGMEGGDKEGERVDTGIRECYRRDEAEFNNGFFLSDGILCGVCV